MDLLVLARSSIGTGTELRYRSKCRYLPYLHVPTATIHRVYLLLHYIEYRNNPDTDSQWVPLRTPATTLRRQRWVHNGNNASVRDTSEPLSNQKTQNGNFHCQTDPRWKSGIRSRGQIGNRRDKMETSTVRGTKWKLTQMEYHPKYYS